LDFLGPFIIAISGLFEEGGVSTGAGIAGHGHKQNLAQKSSPTSIRRPALVSAVIRSSYWCKPIKAILSAKQTQLNSETRVLAKEPYAPIRSRESMSTGWTQQFYIYHSCHFSSIHRKLVFKTRKKC
jgi:hypothetical protein